MSETLTPHELQVLQIVALRKGWGFICLATGLPQKVIEAVVAHRAPDEDTKKLKNWIKERISE